jgi:hypothetical protein
MSDNTSQIKNPVLRVTQLDTNELNNSLLNNLKHAINEDFFKYIQSNLVQRYHVEIFSVLKLVLWHYTYGKSGQTVGMSILDWSYSHSNKHLIFAKKIIHACVFCLDEWFEERFLSYLKNFLTKSYLYINKSNNENSSQFERKLNKIIDCFFRFYKILSALNFIVFLLNGKYLNLYERFLRFRPVYNNVQFMTQTNSLSEASIREELFHTYFSIFKLGNSLFNFQKFYKNYIQKLNSKKILPMNRSININSCGICDKEPVMAHRSNNVESNENQCKHIFCYYCIKQALVENDDVYNCKLCSNYINKIELYVKI